MELNERLKVLLLFLSEEAGQYPSDQVRIMKGLFLLSRPNHVLDGEYKFVPYSYGPFDPQVYRDINSLWLSGLIEVRANSGSTRIHTLTPEGSKLTHSLRAEFSKQQLSDIRAAKERVSQKPFRRMLEDIYQEYPEFSENSVLV